VETRDNGKTTQYIVAFTDLNGDGIPEAIVLLRSGGWCERRLHRPRPDPKQIFLENSNQANDNTASDPRTQGYDERMARYHSLGAGRRYLPRLRGPALLRWLFLSEQPNSTTSSEIGERSGRGGRDKPDAGSRALV